LINSIPEGDALGTDGAALHVEFGAVQYVDHHRDSNPFSGLQQPTWEFFMKRKSFEYEQEFRALVYGMPLLRDGVESVFPDDGVAVPVDLVRLIESIYVAPGAPAWFLETVRGAVLRAGHDFPVHQSGLDEPALF
jgi:hypothetical protein